MEFAFLQDRATGNQDDKTSAAADAVWILGIFGIVETSKVGVRVAVDMDMVGWFHDEPFIFSTFEILTEDALESLTVTFCLLECVPRALVDSKQDVWAGVTSKIQ